MTYSSTLMTLEFIYFAIDEHAAIERPENILSPGQRYHSPKVATGQSHTT